MRNEEKNVVSCVNSLAALDYDNFEIVIANDSSTDNTKSFALETIKKNSSKIPIKILDAPTLPKGWFGKPWAVSEGAKQAKGKLLWIIDADLKIKPETLKNSINHLLAFEADVMFCFPRLIIRKWWDWPILFLNFVLRFSFWCSSWLGFKQPPASWGENVLVYKSIYEEIGGFEAVKNFIPENQAFIKKTIESKKKVVAIDANNPGISVPLYERFSDSFRGVLRNIDFRLINFFSFAATFIIISFSIDGLIKFLAGFAENSFLSYGAFVALFAVYLIFSRQPVYVAFFAPILGIYSIIVFMIAGFYSASNKTVIWKDRPVKLDWRKL